VISFGYGYKRKEASLKANLLNLIGVPRGIRTPVIAVKEGWGRFLAKNAKWATGNGFELTF
jgi:hypothetical protein